MKKYGICCLFIQAPHWGRSDIVGIGNTFVVAQIRSVNRLLQPSVSNTGTLNRNNDVMCETKSERKLRHRKELPPKKLIDGFKNCRSIKIVLQFSRAQSSAQIVTY